MKGTEKETYVRMEADLHAEVQQCEFYNNVTVCVRLFVCSTYGRNKDALDKSISSNEIRKYDRQRTCRCFSPCEHWYFSFPQCMQNDYGGLSRILFNEYQVDCFLEGKGSQNVNKKTHFK